MLPPEACDLPRGCPAAASNDLAQHRLRAA
jgi:hypothetical protein